MPRTTARQVQVDKWMLTKRPSGFKLEAVAHCSNHATQTVTVDFDKVVYHDWHLQALH